MKTLRKGSVVRISVLAVLMAFTVASSTASAKTMMRKRNTGPVMALPRCTNPPKTDKFGHTCFGTPCKGYNAALKCCYKYSCIIVH